MVLGRDKLSHVRRIPGVNEANSIELKAGRDETCREKLAGQIVPSAQGREAALARVTRPFNFGRLRRIVIAGARLRLDVRHSQHRSQGRTQALHDALELPEIE
jgi:hypothetical protein